MLLVGLTEFGAAALSRCLNVVIEIADLLGKEPFIEDVRWLLYARKDRSGCPPRLDARQRGGAA